MRTFQHPEPPPTRNRVAPLFMPHAGCPGTCVFCAQELQTGTARKKIRELPDCLRLLLDERSGPCELAFYGGTFTSLPFDTQLELLSMAMERKQGGQITRIRCSTRPDALSLEHLETLRHNGLDMVELGIQSFSNIALDTSGRGYDDGQALAACAMVREAGLALGVQLLPGLPGLEQKDFRRDIEICTDIRPELVRLYPCLVLRGTGLEKMWEQGRYHPWNVRRTVNTLGAALPRLWKAGIRVGRIGVAQEPGFQEQIKAGPWHPALGARARGAALCRIIRGEIIRLGRKPRSIHIPKRYQGEFWGHEREWAPVYSAMGLERDAVSVWEDPKQKDFRLE